MVSSSYKMSFWGSLLIRKLALVDSMWLSSGEVPKSVDCAFDALASIKRGTLGLLKIPQNMTVVTERVGQKGYTSEHV